ncbi:MAG: sodium:proton antiporter [Candidatus Omnitrophica bacterium]|nr:sodium:proton antiporter [Candidatus Omnitrophota bacterium]
MITKHTSLVVNQSCRIMLPFIQLFALYVIGHGHYSPGGGFQGGVLLAAAALLLRLTLGPGPAGRLARPAIAPLLGAAGVMIYAGTGLPALLYGLPYLDYHWLAEAMGAHSHAGLAAWRGHGILMVEIGVGLAVYSVLALIFDALVGRAEA